MELTLLVCIWKIPGFQTALSVIYIGSFDFINQKSQRRDGRYEEFSMSLTV